MVWLFPQQILTVDSGEIKADVLVVLGGSKKDRSERAMVLFKQGVSTKILITGSDDCILYKQFLISHGVPENAIHVESKSHTTRENAKFSIPLLHILGAKRVIIVTSWYHSRRALACFEHYSPDIIFYSRPSYFGYFPTKIDRREINRYVKSEYLKLLGYWIFYGVRPF